MKNKLIIYFMNNKDPIPKINYKNKEIYSPYLRRKLNKFAILHILRQIGIILKHMEKNQIPYFS